MTIPLHLLDAMVYGALFICAAAPIILLVLLVKDWKEGRLW